jgi:hypothetical protein
MKWGYILADAKVLLVEEGRARVNKKKLCQKAQNSEEKMRETVERGEENKKKNPPHPPMQRENQVISNKVRKKYKILDARNLNLKHSQLSNCKNTQSSRMSCQQC